MPNFLWFRFVCDEPFLLPWTELLIEITFWAPGPWWVGFDTSIWAGNLAENSVSTRAARTWWIIRSQRTWSALMHIYCIKLYLTLLHKVVEFIHTEWPQIKFVCACIETTTLWSVLSRIQNSRNIQRENCFCCEVQPKKKLLSDGGEHCIALKQKITHSPYSYHTGMGRVKYYELKWINTWPAPITFPSTTHRDRNRTLSWYREKHKVGTRLVCGPVLLDPWYLL